MPRVDTVHFGVLDYGEEAVLEFPAGLPAFEEEKRFLAIERPSAAPFVFLQSLSRTDLAFVTLPVRLVDPGYELAVAVEDLEALGLAKDRQPALDAEVLCLAIVTLVEDRPPTANLMAPVLINLATRRALQAVRCDTAYSHRHPLAGPAEEGRC